jgi:hypothetical protein
MLLVKREPVISVLQPLKEVRILRVAFTTIGQVKLRLVKHHATRTYGGVSYSSSHS